MLNNLGGCHEVVDGPSEKSVHIGSHENDIYEDFFAAISLIAILS